MFEVNSIDHIVLTVKDIQKSVEFYTNILGMKEEIFKGNRVALKFGHQKINLHELGNEFEPKAQNVKEGSADLCFITQMSVLEFKNHIESFGIEIIEGPIKRTGANGEINSIYLRDPDGNLIEVSNYIYAI
ncbi:VOC family protein [Halarcobacter ebronensis]|uniref:VOC family virulence protein n=1 Tax=Halarcobacter ebronensis TaxID=1462615 RepID=A0A4Q1AUH2_9BACT|nr:VOC family protein [Halarcobacter ebronensis]QKF80527.1 vicinal oxygen chelate (VOC) family protein [Halarcobacter ebronensis]RXK08335.1 VOC family virulence protein [Halarcobacter ebronensis]